jgi:hypothetical protein
MDREFGSNISYSAVEDVINNAKKEYKYSKVANVALDEVLEVIKLNYTYLAYNGNKGE